MIAPGRCVVVEVALVTGTNTTDVDDTVVFTISLIVVTLIVAIEAVDVVLMTASSEKLIIYFLNRIT